MSQSNVEYDLDTKGGILSQVYALIAPPQSEESKSKKKEGLDLHPYYRRPGKGHNRDTCDACQEGGSLLCCDRCPASFHFICVDPPIDEEKDIPLGGWECNKCSHEMIENVESEDISIKGKGKGKGKSVSAPTRRELRAKEQTVSEEPSSNKDEEEGDIVSGKGKGKGKSAPAPTKRELRAKEREEKNSQDEGGILRKAFQVLIKNAVKDNPKEFALPREYQSNFQFPGSDKVVPARIMNRRSSGAKRKPYELDTNGNVPLPAKCCFVCGKSCREKKMVACDYCPLFFHLDCLDPPLTSRPDRNWICPNHNQPFLETKMLKNDSYTKRLKLWESFSLQPVDQQTVKLQFFDTVRQRNLMKRFHVRSSPRGHVQVPESVKAAYANPAPLLPGFNELVRLKAAMKSGATATCCSHCSMNNNGTIQDSYGNNKSAAKLTGVVFSKAEQNISQSDLQLWLSSVLKMQHDYIKEFCPPETLKEVQENNYAKILAEKEIVKKDTDPPSSFNHDVMNGESEFSSNPKELVNIIYNGVSQSMNGHISSESDDSNRKRRLSLEDCMKKVVPEKKICYDEDTMLIPVPNSEDGNFFRLNDRDNEMKLLAQRLHHPAAGKGKTDFKTNNQTDYQSKKVCSISNEERGSNSVRKQSSASLNSEDTVLRNCCSSVRNQVKLVKQIVMKGVLALLAPVRGCDGPVSPVYRNKITSIGSNSFCDINLRCYGHCKNASDLHAAIFFNHIHQRYELLNYSCLGCMVDNKRIGFEGGKSRQVDCSSSKFRETLGEILGVDRLNQLDRIAQLVKKEGVDNKQKTLCVPCKCQGEPAPLPSWEGMTEIMHGSLIQIGCIKLVFTVIEKNSNSEQNHSTTQSSTVASTISDKSSNNNEDWNRPSTSGCSNFEVNSVTKTMRKYWFQPGSAR